MSNFEDGYLLGNRLPKGALGVVLLMREGFVGTTSEAAPHAGVTPKMSSCYIRTMRDMELVHITDWQDGIAIYRWGRAVDVNRPMAKAVKRLTKAVEKHAEYLAERKARIEKMVEETTPEQIEDAERFRRTQYGKETTNGNVRTHRIE